MNKILKTIQEQRTEESYLDFSVFSYEKDKLIIVASDDLSYYHTLEIILTEVLFIEGVFEWRWDDIKKNFSNLNELITIQTQGEYQKVIFFEDLEKKLLILAKNVTINFDRVFYYKREDLKENERLAYFVK